MVIFEISNIFAENISEMNKIIGIGNALVDVLVRVPDETVIGSMNLVKGAMQLVDETAFERISYTMSRMETACTTGGSAANTVLTLARLGAEPGFLGCVGNDSRGRFWVDHFRKQGVSTYCKISSSNVPTGVASTFITPDGERTFGTFLGAASQLSVTDIDAGLFEGYSYVYVEGYLVQNAELLEHILRTAYQAGLKVCMDLASFNVVSAHRNLLLRLLDDYVEVVFANEDEGDALAEGSDTGPLDLLARLCRVAVLKQGPKGASACCDGNKVCSAAVEVPAVLDTTAAGDYFAAGFMYAFMRGCSLQVCADAGNLCSSYVIQTVGTALSDEAWSELRQKMFSLCGD